MANPDSDGHRIRAAVADPRPATRVGLPLARGPAGRGGLGRRPRGRHRDGDRRSCHPGGRRARRPGTERGDEIVPFNNVRKRAAGLLLASKQTSAHTLGGRAHRLLGDRSRYARRRRATDVPAVRRARRVSTRCAPIRWSTPRVDGDALVVHKAINLGIAVDLDYQGLVVPVVHGADGLRLHALAAAIHDVASAGPVPRSSPSTISRAARSRSPTRARRARGSRSRSSTSRKSASCRPTACRSRSSSTSAAASRSRPSATSASRSTTARSTAPTRARSSSCCARSSRPATGAPSSN